MKTKKMQMNRLIDDLAIVKTILDNATKESKNTLERIRFLQLAMQNISEAITGLANDLANEKNETKEGA